MTLNVGKDQDQPPGRVRLEVVGLTGLGRESLCKALSPDGNPEFATVLKVVRSLGLNLHVAAR